MISIKQLFVRTFTILQIVFLLTFFFLLYCIIREKQYISKKKKTELGITVAELEKDWGKPDKIMTLAKEEKVFFYNAYLGSQIIFIVKDNIILSSHIDD